MEAEATAGAGCAAGDEKNGSETQPSKEGEESVKEGRPAGVKRGREEEHGASEEEELER